MAVRQKNSPVVRIADEEDEDVDDVDLRLELDDDDDFAIVKGDYASGKSSFSVRFRRKYFSSSTCTTILPALIL